MSRKQFQFIQTDPDDIISWMTAKYEAFTGVTVQPGSPERLFIQWTSAVIIQERALANYAANQNLPSRAEGSNLDALSEAAVLEALAANRAGRTIVLVSHRATASTLADRTYSVDRGGAS